MIGVGHMEFVKFSANGRCFSLSSLDLYCNLKYDQSDIPYLKHINLIIDLHSGCATNSQRQFPLIFYSQLAGT